MSEELRIYMTDAGPTCGTCVIDEARRGQAVPHDFAAPVPDACYSSDDEERLAALRAFSGWPGGLCALCQHDMPADGAPEGRTRPTTMADLGEVTLEEARAAVRRGRGTVLGNDFQRVTIRYAGEVRTFPWPRPLPLLLPHREVFEARGFRHPGDLYLVMVLARPGRRPQPGEVDDREWATWYYNLECGGFNEGHYFDPGEEAEARRDFEERCKRYC